MTAAETRQIEATRFTITPPIDVAGVHNVQVHVEQRRDNSWTAAYQGLWFDAEGIHHPACGANAARCCHDLASAMRVAVEAAKGIAERFRRSVDPRGDQPRTSGQTPEEDRNANT